MKLLLQVFPNISAMSVYGPTEVTAVTVHHPYSGSPDHIVIGTPDANTHVYIVDARLRPVPVGVPGELLLSGPRLAIGAWRYWRLSGHQAHAQLNGICSATASASDAQRLLCIAGYVGRPDLTAEKFIPNPCLDLVRDSILSSMSQFYERAYRSGDLVRWRADGTIDFLGRIDRQVKVNGVRIELGEVEAALASAPGIIHTVVVPLPDPSGSLRLVGYAMPSTISTAEAIAHCRTLLVPAMVPSMIVPLDNFPLLSNGKVDIKALPPPDWGAAGAEEYVAPASELETMVQRVWQEVLGRSEDQPLSVTADFFAAGGTSLQVFRVVAALQKLLGLDSVPPTLLHTERSIRNVAAALAASTAAGHGEAIKPRAWPNAFRPLSANQEQMWLLR